MTRHKSKTPGYDQGLQGSTSASSAGPVVVYRSESTPLLPGKPQDRRQLVVQCAIRLGTFLAVLVVGVNLCLHVYYCPLYPSTMDAMRREWEKEAAQHAIVREQWTLEVQQHEAIKEQWQRESEYHERDEARRIRKENERQERVRQEWDTEAEEHRQEVARKAHEEEKGQERVRKKWDQEAESHKRECEEMERRRENERQKWQHEVEDHDHIEQERRKRETEERQKLNMFWDSIKARTCTTYATREYTAQLMNLPATWEHRVEACKATPLEVHGTSYLPKSCEDKGPGVVIGRWEIDQREPDCTTFWNRYKDKGCTSPGSGKRRIEHYLENLPEGSDWREFCATTPARFRGMEFPGPHECYQYKLGTYGLWEVDDTKCQ